jgi:hypothetical protein
MTTTSSAATAAVDQSGSGSGGGSGHGKSGKNKGGSSSSSGGGASSNKPSGVSPPSAELLNEHGSHLFVPILRQVHQGKMSWRNISPVSQKKTE